MIAHRGATITALGACTLLVVWFCTQHLRIESGLDELLSWSARGNNSDVVSKFEAETEIVVLVEGDVLSRESLERVRDVRDALRALALPHDAPPGRNSAAAYAQAPARKAFGSASDWTDELDATHYAPAAADAIVFREVATVVD